MLDEISDAVHNGSTILIKIGGYSDLLDSSTLGQLLLLREKVAKKQGSIKIKVLDDINFKVMQTANFHRLFKIEPDY
ncbi:hypothetical protein [Magnetococcus marinus]|uniref:hypothetical protein n=1 Tax=Magnetococcus marinus TaxID=1124597 RepID=UPI00059F263F|nr:hypothetical protein [Magnetococcus marinus]